MSITIGLYFNNFGFSEIDLSKPEEGNPGIGGTHFNFITLPYYFNKFHPGKVKWYLIGPDNNKLPDGIEPVHISSPDDLDKVLSAHELDYLIWKPANTLHITDLLEQHQQPGIAWCNNIPEVKELNAIADSEMVKSVVFAGHEALDVVRDHRIILKSTVIFNGFNSSPFLRQEETSKDPDLVVFLGSLFPAKCFHILAQAWPTVISKRPEARLEVIGSGELYNRNQKMGKHGLAEKAYEEKLIAPLLDESGNILSSVKFHGLMGAEKTSLLKKASVGVINPHGMSEVCPGSALEFQAGSTPVVAGARFGNLDTVIDNKTGFLVKNITSLADRICELLDSKDKVIRMGKEGRKFVSETFDQQIICQQWADHFDQLKTITFKGNYPSKKNYGYNFKWLIELLRIIKFKIGIAPRFPSLYEIAYKFKKS